MDNNKKDNKIIKYLVSILSLIAIIVGILVLFKYTDKSSKTTDELALEKYEVSELKETSTKVADFKIEIDGAYEGEITPEILSSYDVHTYEFYAGILKNGKVVTSKYEGYKLVDIFGAMDIAEYDSLEFSDSQNYTVNMKSVTDDAYIVFKENDEEISPLLLITNKPYDKSLEMVVKLHIYNDIEQ